MRGDFSCQILKFRLFRRLQTKPYDFQMILSTMLRKLLREKIVLFRLLSFQLSVLLWKKSRKKSDYLIQGFKSFHWKCKDIFLYMIAKILEWWQSHCFGIFLFFEASRKSDFEGSYSPLKCKNIFFISLSHNLSENFDFARFSDKFIAIVRMFWNIFSKNWKEPVSTSWKNLCPKKRSARNQENYGQSDAYFHNHTVVWI